MIKTKTPLRIPLGGGGTDLKSYYQENEGFLISAAINKYVQVTLDYDQLDSAQSLNSQNELLIETLKFMNIQTPLRITTTSDIPAGTGLGSSGSFLVALLKALHEFKNEPTTPFQLAEEACTIEMELLKKPVGKQDQYVSSFGGIIQQEISKTGQVKITKLNLKSNVLQRLEQNLLIFFTGITRKSEDILSKQQNLISNHALDKIKKISKKIKLALIEGNLDEFGRLMHLHWQAKKQISSFISSDQIDHFYEIGLKNGALGGKIMGAGGGGYFLFYCPNEMSKLKLAMERIGLTRLPFKFEFEGVHLLKNEKPFLDQAFLT